MNFYLICYDIADDRRRIKAARVLERSAKRVQASVFEAYMPLKVFEGVIEEITGGLDEDLDSLRAYVLCGACREKVWAWGRGRVTEMPGLVVV